MKNVNKRGKPRPIRDGERVYIKLVGILLFLLGFILLGVSYFSGTGIFTIYQSNGELTVGLFCKYAGIICTLVGILLATIGYKMKNVVPGTDFWH